MRWLRLVTIVVLVTSPAFLFGCLGIPNFGFGVLDAINPDASDGESGQSEGDATDSESDAASPSYQLVFSSYTNTDGELQLRTVDDADPLDAMVWISGEFPRFLIHWSADLDVNVVKVKVNPPFETAYSIFTTDDEGNSDPSGSILPPVVYGAYNVPGTQPLRPAPVPAPTITIGEGSRGSGGSVGAIFLDGVEADEFGNLGIEVQDENPDDPFDRKIAKIYYQVKEMDFLQRLEPDFTCDPERMCFEASP
jgi:hypothetical protein